jgi:hypothetical protein
MTGSSALLALGGVLSLLNGLSSLDTMTHWLPKPFPFHADSALPYAAGGFFLLLFAFRWIREEPIGPEHPRWTLGILGLILAAGAFLRIYPPNGIDPLWSEDYAIMLNEGRTAADISEARPLIFEYCSHQPLMPYLLALGYALIPKISALLLMKIVWALVDGAAIWVHYLLGREVAGRRVGLILAAAFAFSKPGIANCVCHQQIVTTPLALGLSLLFTLRFLRKPDKTHALYWAVAVAFGAYCYTGIHPYLWFSPVAAMVYLLLRPLTAGARRPSSRAWA